MLAAADSTSRLHYVVVDDFWSFFFTQQHGYGLAVYEQDFMYSQYDNVEELQTNATFADDWLGSMARHAAKAGHRMQCAMWLLPCPL